MASALRPDIEEYLNKLNETTIAWETALKTPSPAHETAFLNLRNELNDIVIRLMNTYDKATTKLPSFRTKKIISLVALKNETGGVKMPRVDPFKDGDTPATLDAWKRANTDPSQIFEKVSTSGPSPATAISASPTPIGSPTMPSLATPPATPTSPPTTSTSPSGVASTPLLSKTDNWTDMDASDQKEIEEIITKFQQDDIDRKKANADIKDIFTSNYGIPVSEVEDYTAWKQLMSRINSIVLNSIQPSEDLSSLPAQEANIKTIAQDYADKKIATKGEAIEEINKILFKGVKKSNTSKYKAWVQAVALLSSTSPTPATPTVPAPVAPAGAPAVPAPVAPAVPAPVVPAGAPAVAPAGAPAVAPAVPAPVAGDGMPAGFPPAPAELPDGVILPAGYRVVPIVPEKVDLGDVAIEKEVDFKKLRFADLTLQQIENYKELLNQVPDVEATWNQTFDDSLIRGYENKQDAKTILNSSRWNKGFSERSMNDDSYYIQDVGGYQQQIYEERYLGSLRLFGEMVDVVDEETKMYYEPHEHIKEVPLPKVKQGEKLRHQEFIRAYVNEQPDVVEDIYTDEWEPAGKEWGDWSSVM